MSPTVSSSWSASRRRVDEFLRDPRGRFTPQPVWLTAHHPGGRLALWATLVGVDDLQRLKVLTTAPLPPEAQFALHSAENDAGDSPSYVLDSVRPGHRPGDRACWIHTLAVHQPD